MTEFELGHMTLGKVCAALGITGPVNRVIIDINIDDVARVYVHQILEAGKIEEVLADPNIPQPVIVEGDNVEVDSFGRIWRK